MLRLATETGRKANIFIGHTQIPHCAGRYAEYQNTFMAITGGNLNTFEGLVDHQMRSGVVIEHPLIQAP